MASVVKRRRKDGSRSYHVKYRAGDGRVRWEQFERAKDASARKAEVELALARSGGNWSPPASIAFADYVEAWLERIRPTVKARVHENYRRELERAKAEFGGVPLAGITRSHVRTLVALRASEGAAANTIRNMLIPLKALFGHALDESLVPANPASRVALPPARTRKIVPPSREQVEKLVHAARRWYSWRSTPSRSRRCTLLGWPSPTMLRSAGGSGGSSLSARCGRWVL